MVSERTGWTRNKRKLKCVQRSLREGIFRRRHGKRGEEVSVIGITGGVGSGKSEVLKLLEQEYGAHVIQADLVARELMEPGEASYQAVVKAFSEAICKPDGSIDRPKLADIVFQNPEKRELLNRLTHPLVKQELRRRILLFPGKLTVLEAALPVEAGFREFCDSIWYVYAPEAVRLERLQKGRGYSREKCQEIMKSQLSEEEFRAVSDVVIENGGSFAAAKAQIHAILAVRSINDPT
ncbi:dephospho-CoA kinase [Hominifimenecus sp. rT4P-3]|uniref:dephospho-CoA kinase n=1 Tax=Hominifimenecus sp. rT4P-3 TaxID=3242979 RepID=UPI003DA38245